MRIGGRSGKRVDGAGMLAGGDARQVRATPFPLELDLYNSISWRHRQPAIRQRAVSGAEEERKKGRARDQLSR
jgi:hypothetical protein